MLDAEVVCTHNMNQIQCFNPERKLCVCECDPDVTAETVSRCRKQTLFLWFVRRRHGDRS